MGGARADARPVGGARAEARMSLAAVAGGLLLAALPTAPRASAAHPWDAGPSPVAAAPSPASDVGGLPYPARLRGLMAPGTGLAMVARPPRLDGRALTNDAGALVPTRLSSPKISGLSWRSGASCADPAFAAWRGRAVDAHVLFAPSASWQATLDYFGGGFFKGRVRLSPQPVVSLGLMPRSVPKEHAACARGEFDGYFRQFGALMQRAGAGGAVVRLGWEANIGSGSHPWGMDTQADITGYVKCFRRAAAQLKLTAPGVKIEWTNAKASTLPVSDLAANPGDDVTDLWGLHYYDVNGQFNIQKRWDEFYVLTRLGGPQGLGTWFAEAKKHGKKLGVPEWGVWSRSVSAATADNPLYIQNIYNAFKANAADLAYENYYNCPVVHRLYPDSQFPKASALYRKLWSAGK